LSDIKKVVLIVRKDLSSWKSCQSITSNLHKSYTENFKNKDCSTFYISKSSSNYEAAQLAQRLRDCKAELIVWLDHHPCPAIFLKHLCIEFANVPLSKRPRLVIHVFGDFVLDCRKWESSLEDLQQWPVHLITASKKQQKLIESFFKFEGQVVSTIPFPVNESIFNSNEFSENRDLLREELGIDKNNLVLLYTGRVSLQKNIDTLIKIFEMVKPFVDKNISLVIAGPWDDILVPYFGKHGICGSYFNYFSRTMGTLKSKDVKFVGNLNSEELVKYYQAADSFISFSTYNDEDFGMSPAEAICSGLPSLLSDWGGYTSFGDYTSGVSLVTVTKNTDRPCVQTLDARNQMFNLIERIPYTVEQRKKISKEALLHLSVSSVAAKIEQMLNHTEFGSIIDFSDKFLQLCSQFKKKPNTPFNSNLHQDVYAVY
jgi:glycosyltransferase involved in cell wall biosynthesis